MLALGSSVPLCRDVVTDTVHQFAPAYHDYVLYSDGTRKQTTPPKTVRTRTFVAGIADQATCPTSQCCRAGAVASGWPGTCKLIAEAAESAETPENYLNFSSSRETQRWHLVEAAGMPCSAAEGLSGLCAAHGLITASATA